MQSPRCRWHLSGSLCLSISSWRPGRQELLVSISKAVLVSFLLSLPVPCSADLSGGHADRKTLGSPSYGQFLSLSPPSSWV